MSISGRVSRSCSNGAGAKTARRRQYRGGAASAASADTRRAGDPANGAAAVCAPHLCSAQLDLSAVTRRGGLRDRGQRHPSVRTGYCSSEGRYRFQALGRVWIRTAQSDSRQYPALILLARGCKILRSNRHIIGLSRLLRFPRRLIECSCHLTFIRVFSWPVC